MAYAPMATHIVIITFAPSLTNHRMATQCGAETMNGEKMKPVIVSGAQYMGYK